MICSYRNGWRDPGCDAHDAVDEARMERFDAALDRFTNGCIATLVASDETNERLRELMAWVVDADHNETQILTQARLLRDAAFASITKEIDA